MIASIYDAGAEADAVAFPKMNASLGGAFIFNASFSTSGLAPATFNRPVGSDCFLARIDDTLARYADDIYRGDLTMSGVNAQVMAGAADGLLRSDDLPWRDAEYVRWNFARVGTRSWIADWRRSGPGEVDLTVLHRMPDQPPVDAASAAAFRSLNYHLAAARRIAIRRERDADDRDPRPVLVLDGGKRLRYANAAADRFLTTGRVFVAVNGRVGCRQAEVARRFDPLVRAAAAPFGTGCRPTMLAVPADDGGAPHIVSIGTTRLDADAASGGCLAAHIRVLDRREAPKTATITAWRQLFDLTKAEACVAAALVANDKSLRGVAADLGVSYNTARTHVAHILAKTGTISQTGLIRLLTRIE